MESVLVGAFKVKDGLFIGDEFAAQDLEFVVANKVSRIVNCASRQVPNHWEPIGITYLSFPWFDTENQVLLDSSDKSFSVFYPFIEKGLETGESVLIHSVRGVSRCVCVVTSYLIKKYSWSLYKSLDFIAFRRPDLDLNPAFLSQLANFENRVFRVLRQNKTEEWDQVNGGEEELALRNTYLNARLGQPTDYHIQNSEEGEKEVKIKWEENNEDGTKKSRNLVEGGLVVIKSCIKGNSGSGIKVPVFNLDNLKARTCYDKFGSSEFDTGLKKRSASLNKADNKLVKEAISAARGLDNDDFKIKTRPKILKVSRPITAPQKRSASPKGEKKILNLRTKGVSHGTIRKK